MKTSKYRKLIDMKTLKYFMIIIGMATILTMIGCGAQSSDPTPIDPLEVQKELLINGGRPWTISGVSSVTKDGYDVSSQFDGFKLTFGEGNFTTTNSLSNVWPTVGTWEFNAGNKNQIMRSDGILMDIVITSGNLSLVFIAIGTDEGGRVDSVEGEFRFSLISE